MVARSPVTDRLGAIAGLTSSSSRPLGAEREEHAFLATAAPDRGRT
jgi:hypothetical protein